MLLAVHQVLRRLLYERGKISPQEVEIRFEAPTQDHIDRLLLPTINLFLFEVQENVELRQNTYQTTRGNGRAERRPTPKRFDLRFMVSALSSEIEDEHLLLWRALSTLVRYPQIPEELLPEEVRRLDIPLVTRLCESDEGGRLSSIWSGLGTQPRAALDYTVTVPVELETVIEAPLVLTRVARYKRLSSSELISETDVQVGGVVRNRRGEALAGVRVSIEGRASESITDAEGRFILRNVPASQVNLRVTSADGQSQVLMDVALTPQSAQRAGEAGPLYEIIL
jgi:hypothetical protein